MITVQNLNTKAIARGGSRLLILQLVVFLFLLEKRDGSPKEFTKTKYRMRRNQAVSFPSSVAQAMTFRNENSEEHLLPREPKSWKHKYIYNSIPHNKTESHEKKLLVPYISVLRARANKLGFVKQIAYSTLNQTFRNIIYKPQFQLRPPIFLINQVVNQLG